MFKEEEKELLYQKVHMVTTTQELYHSTQNFVRLVGDYLVDKVLFSQAMATWPHHIDQFDQKYDKAFAGNPFFGAYLVGRVHKRVQVFLHLCNTT